MSFGLGTDASYELTRGGNLGDKVHPLPGPDHRGIEISVLEGGSEPKALLIQRRAEVVLPSVPAFHKRIAYGATGVGLGPRVLAHHVEDPRSLCIATLGGHDALLGPFVARSFGGRVETSSHQWSLRTEHEGRRQSTPVAAAAGGQHDRRRYRVPHRGPHR